MKTNDKISVAVIGAAGYAGGELLRLLLEHPHVERETLQCLSESQAFKRVSEVHEDLFSFEHLTFTNELKPCSLVFLSGDHGQALQLIAKHDVFNRSSRVIDLSHDFRDGSEGFTYGLSEVNRENIEQSTRIANPGCFATAIQLALAPLARAKLLHETVHVTALTGSTGAGQKLQKSSHFSQRNQNLSSYKVFAHQHLAEIKKTLGTLQGASPLLPPILFVPMRGPFTRGILASLYTACDLSREEVLSLYQNFYKGSPFVHVEASHDDINLKSVVNTNTIRLQVQTHSETGEDGQTQNLLHIVACLDNLIKGASGQAVQNMNLMMGWPEDSGLRLKSIAY